MSTAARSRGLPRLLESVSARVWLIDREGLLVYVSPALCDWLGVSADALTGLPCMLPAQSQSATSERSIGQTPSETGSKGSHASAERIALALAPSRELLHRGHHTCRIAAASLYAPSGSSAEEPLSAMAHFVRLDGMANGSSGSNPTNEVTNGSLVLGCIGSYRSDSELPWDDWFGPEGIRQATRIDERLAQHRAVQQRIVSTMLLGTSVAVQRFRSRVELVGSHRHHVGIFGLPGCCSEHLAQQLHHASAPNEPLVVLDGSLMDQELLAAYAEPVLHPLRESTEATGTLLIERLDEMPLDVQSDLCDWVDHWQGRLRLIGLVDSQCVSASADSTTTEPSDLEDRSLVSELESLIHRPTASNGLHQRLGTLLATLPVFVPSLSQRLDDLDEIAEAMIGQVHATACQAHSRNRSSSPKQSSHTGGWLEVPRLSREFIEALHVYPWPSQWQELESAMRYAYGSGSFDRLTRDHLPLVIRSYQPGGSQSSLARPGSQPKPGSDEPDRKVQSYSNEFASLDLSDFKSLDEATQKCEQYLIEKAVRAADGNKAEAARRLGISRARLLRKLQE